MAGHFHSIHLSLFQTLSSTTLFLSTGCYVQMTNDQLPFWDDKTLPKAASNHLARSLLALNNWAFERTISAETLTLSFAD